MRRNLGYNQSVPAVALCATHSAVGDAFAVMRGMFSAGERFDLTIIDPPSFASKQADVDGALAAYAKLTDLAIGLTVRGGVLVQSSCSSRVPATLFFDTIRDAARSVGRPLDEIERTHHAVDNPIGFAQGAYLKTMFAQVP